jgi:hypothetical protein
VQFLLDHECREAAAIAVDSPIEESYEGSYDPVALRIWLPTSAYGMVNTNEHLKRTMEQALRAISKGHITDRNGQPIDVPIIFIVSLMEVEEGWQDVVRRLIVQSQDPNQAAVTEKVFSREGKQPHIYNEMKFASKSEIRIAQELEARGVLFFPLPLAVRAETGNRYQDHREPDFLVCKDGAWGILEVSFHPDRFEKDQEKDTWFKKAGILCIQHYTAERCYKNPADVVDEFLEILAQHKR